MTTDYLYELAYHNVSYSYEKPSHARVDVGSTNSEAALRNISVTLKPHTIVGLFGSNGSGKTTLMKLGAGRMNTLDGDVTMTAIESHNADAEDTVATAQPCSVPVPVFGNDRATARVAYVAPDAYVENTKLKNLVKYSCSRPGFDSDCFLRLADDFRVDLKKRLRSMSTGQRSLALTLFGIASRAPIVMLDEVHVGLDVQTRYKLYDTILEDYATSGRTYVLSSHIIGELDSIVERVIVLHQGKKILEGEAEELRSMAGDDTGSSPLQAGYVALMERVGVGSAQSKAHYDAIDQPGQNGK